MVSEMTRSELWVEQVRLQYKQTPIALGVNIAIAAITSVALGSVEAALPIGLWFGLIVVTACARAVVYFAYRRADLAYPKTHIWEKLALIGAGLSGSLWGFGLAILFPQDRIYQVFVCLTVAGMCAGAVVVHSSHFRSLLSFLLPAGLPIAVRFLLEGTAADIALAGMMIVFVLALSFAGYNFNRALVEGFRLSEDLSRRARELDAAYTQLTQERRRLCERRSEFWRKSLSAGCPVNASHCLPRRCRWSVMVHASRSNSGQPGFRACRSDQRQPQSATRVLL
jgi:hypothetical protein